MNGFRQLCKEALTKTEYAIASEHLCRGLCNKEIATQRFKTIRGIKFHIENILRKTSMPSRARFIYKWWSDE